MITQVYVLNTFTLQKIIFHSLLNCPSLPTELFQQALGKTLDVMVVFGRLKGDRGSYLQWQEDSIPPQVIFEILSPGNTQREMIEKYDFYRPYGVEEYYLY
ncbi:protein of unknown function DUF820 [Richelia intracellularis]|nr:protein of unknown function DUF820 [Richelia intracellularis]